MAKLTRLASLKTGNVAVLETDNDGTGETTNPTIRYLVNKKTFIDLGYEELCDLIDDLVEIQDVWERIFGPVNSEWWED